MNYHHVDAAVPRQVNTTVRRTGPALLIVILLALNGCSSSTPPPTAEPPPTATAPPVAQSDPTHRPLAADPIRLADDLVADEEALRDQSASEEVLTAAAQRQQAAYRVIGHHPEWDPIIRPRIPEHLVAAYDRNVDARRQLNAMSKGYANDKLPAWRIVAPPAPDELLGYYRKAEAEHGVGWSYLAAINLVETAFGRVDGVSTAGAQGPMQFLPSTFAMYGAGDIRSFHDSIMAAGRYLAASGFAQDRDRALWHYNNSMQYVRAVSRYAEVLKADPAAFDGYYRWDVYYNSTAGDVLLPVGYEATTPIPVDDYLAAHPKALSHRPR